MSRFALFLAVATACSHPAPTPRPAPAVDAARVVIDFAGIDAWLACARTGSARDTCAAARAATPGGRLADAAATTFGDPAETPAPAIDEVATVVAAMKAWPDALARAQRFTPSPVGGGPIRVFVVGNGHPQGDAYAQTFNVAGQPADTGETIVVLAPVLITANYTGEPAVRAAKAFGVLSHELFHVLFRRYRDNTPAWAPLAGTQPPRLRLELLVLNEGIAHFIAREDELARDGFPRDRADATLAALAAAWTRLDGPDADTTLRAASQGSFWNKYGSISGMLFAYGIFRDRGDDGLREAIRCGPGRLLALYTAATARHSELPPAPPLTSAWIDLCRG